MANRLTRKQKDRILKTVDDILANHRLKIYQALTPTITAYNRDAIQLLIGQMNDQLIRDVLPQLDEVLHPPVSSQTGIHPLTGSYPFP